VQACPKPKSDAKPAVRTHGKINERTPKAEARLAEASNGGKKKTSTWWGTLGGTAKGEMSDLDKARSKKNGRRTKKGWGEETGNLRGKISPRRREKTRKIATFLTRLRKENKLTQNKGKGLGLLPFLKVTLEKRSEGGARTIRSYGENIKLADPIVLGRPRTGGGGE